MNCRDFKDMVDSYLSNELLVETNHEILRHLESCANCRAELAGRRELRTRLRSAVKNAQRSQISPGFAARVRSELREKAVGRKSGLAFAGRLPLFAGAVSVILIAAAIGLFVTQRDGEVSVNPQPSPIRSEHVSTPEDPWHLQAAFAAVREDAVEDHKHCALSHNLAEKPISLKEANQRFGVATNGLDAAVFNPLREAFGDDAKFIKAHFCLINGRRFSHVVVEYRKKVVSVLLALRDDETLEMNRDAVECRPSDGLSVACFESGKYSVFVISDLTDGDNLSVAMTMVKSIRDHLSNDAKSA